MSLIVAKKDCNKNIYIISDTKLTYPENYPADKKTNTITNGTIKTFIFQNGNISISFAGNSHIAEVAIEKTNTLDLTNVLEELRTYSIKDQFATDFIVCVYKPFPKIFKIFNGIISTDLDSAWIGDSSGYSFFNELYSEEITKSNVEISLEKAMQKTIERDIFKTIGGYCICVSSENDFFKYKSKAKLSLSTPNTQIGSTPTHIPFFSSCSKGSYCYEIVGNENGVAFYILEAQLGVIYTINPINLTPKILKTEIFFEEIKKLNLELFLDIDNSYSYYFNKGHESYNLKNYKDSVNCFSKALTEKTTSDALYNRGVAYSNIFLQSRNINFFNLAFTDYKSAFNFNSTSKNLYYFYTGKLYFSLSQMINNSGRETYFYKAFEHYTESINLNYNLGECYLDIGIGFSDLSFYSNELKKAIMYYKNSMKYYNLSLKHSKSIFQININKLDLKFSILKNFKSLKHRHHYSSLIKSCVKLIEHNPNEILLKFMLIDLERHARNLTLK